MTNTIAIAALAAALGGGIGAATSTFMAPDRTPDQSANAELTERLALMQRSLDGVKSQGEELMERISSLESSSQVAVLAPARTEVTNLDDYIRKEDLQGLLGGELAEEGAKAVAPKAMVAMVDQALTEIETRKEAERQVRRAEARAERNERRLAEMQEKLGLNSSQYQSMQVAMENREASMDSLRERMRTGREDGTMSREEMRDAWGAVRDELNEEVQQFLTPDQLKTFEEEGYGNFGGRGGGQGRGGRNNGGGGGRGR